MDVRLYAWQRLTALAESCGDDCARLVDAAALAGEADFFDPRADRVSLLTLHAAKGLEFRVVFIVGMHLKSCHDNPFDTITRRDREGVRSFQAQWLEREFLPY